MRKIQTVVIIGAGNVAWHLGHVLHEKGIRILQVISRSLSSAGLLAGAIDAQPGNNLQLLVQDADAYMISVTDDAITDVLQKANFGEGIVMHTAGSVSMEVFEPYVANGGVLYPLQTFTIGRKVDFSAIPVLVEANNRPTLDAISKLAELFAGSVIETDSQTRSLVHMAAVFACNFTNHMLAQAETILEKKNLSIEILKPLIRETIMKALELSPLRAQTGPAMRGDSKVIQQHLHKLDYDPLLQQLYRMISQSIEKLNNGA